MLIKELKALFIDFEREENACEFYIGLTNELIMRINKENDDVFIFHKPTETLNTLSFMFELPYIKSVNITPQSFCFTFQDDLSIAIKR